MKTVISSILSLLVGLFLGWGFEHRRAKHELTDIVHLMMQGEESSARLEAVRAVKAIEWAEAGDTQSIFHTFSIPIQDFYLWYHSDTNDEQTLKALGMIEELAKTNQMVAALLKEAYTNHASGKP